MIGDAYESMQVSCQTIEASNSPSCRTSRALCYKAGKKDALDNKSNMSDYFRSSTNGAADKS